ncbi:hypothetical protein EJ05DRAFT_498518 [Pseudovirgaria hyperparasitica]|uniref:Tetraspanin Tsp3 n=1 Tax=Pseudovirgaria hyperparasitica TaxID=470096 RepID=A0A6A6WEH7_9PEZI|nr:uncharacterized protein EJ05DRAFT_498518 [Pseudovirgaria hyperparasitica]KAF2760559.1 hypothetical protein EJ05DRAFT_498518 [Pseudovirgaria hyperparasitica]
MVSRKKQVVIAINVVGLLATTALVAYALYEINARSLPIPTVLGAITLALPVFSGLSVETVRATNRRRRRLLGSRQASPFISNLVPLFCLTIIEAVLATLAGTHIAPSGDLRCGMERRWQDMFHRKDGNHIRAIQDAFQCCGLASSHDMAWPFPDKQHTARSCEETFGRTKGCMGDWRKDEQQIAAILLIVPIIVFLWQMMVVTAPLEQHSWLGRILPRQLQATSSSGENGNVQRALEYPTSRERYTDDPEDASNIESAPELQETLERLTSAASQEAEAEHTRSHSREPTHEQRDTPNEQSEHNVWSRS